MFLFSEQLFGIVFLKYFIVGTSRILAIHFVLSFRNFKTIMLCRALRFVEFTMNGIDHAIRYGNYLVIVVSDLCLVFRFLFNYYFLSLISFYGKLLANMIVTIL